MKQKSKWLGEENLFRLGSFVLAFLLWLSLIDRKEFQVSHVFNLEFILPENAVVSFQSADSVKVNLSGSRLGVKNWIEQAGHERASFAIDLRSKEPGDHEISLVSLMKSKYSQLNLVSVQPPELRVRLISLVGREQKSER